MENYKDRFTPEQLEELKKSALVNTELKDWERVMDSDDAVPAEVDVAFSDGIIDVFRELFEENRPTPPEDLKDEDYFIWIDEAFFKFVYGALNEIFKDEIENGDAHIILDREAWLTTITHKEIAKEHRKNIAGQLQFSFDKKGNFEIVDEDGRSLTKSILKGNYSNIDLELLEAIGTGIEAKYKAGYRGRLFIARRQFEEYLHVELPAPPPEVLDFINRGGMEAPEEELDEEAKKLKTRIQKHYTYWAEIDKLDRAGMFETPTGTFKALHFRGYNSTTDEIIIESPYYEELFKYLDTVRISSEAMKNDKPVFEDLELVAHLIKGSIVSVRNKATVETVKIILERIKQNGIEPDATRKKHYKYKNKKQIRIDIGYADLMRNNNRLFIQLAKPGITTTSKRNILQRTIFGNEKTKDKYYDEYIERRDGEQFTRKHEISYLEYVIREHTAFRQCFCNFHIECDPISLTKIKRNPRKYGIHITYEGISGDYKDTPALLPPMII